ncbi:MAG TPA: hypothetical protein VHF22_08530, partial [Planctomycetota bacterium]|nr:hypothetical protein [Planctomycetota bacterium]
MRSASALLLLLLAFAPGCATVLLGPDKTQASNNPDSEGLGAALQASPLRVADDLGLTSVLLTYSPADLGRGPATQLSASAQTTLARSLDLVARRADLTDLSERTVYIPGLVRFPRPFRARPAFGERTRPAALVARASDVEAVCARLAERVLEARGQVALDPRDADLILFPWMQISGGITTHRE